MKGTHTRPLLLPPHREADGTTHLSGVPTAVTGRGPHICTGSDELQCPLHL